MASVKHQQVSRLISQVLLDRRFMPASELRQLVADLNRKFDYDLDIDQDPDLNEYIVRLNGPLKFIHLKVVQTRDETTGEHLVVLCNTLASPLSRHPELNENQMALFRQIVERIVQSAQGSISSHEAELAVHDIRNSTLNAVQAEKTIAELIRQKYLATLPENRLCLSPVALVELGPYILSLLDDQAAKCVACTDLCLQGVHCPTADCPAKLHHACAQTLLRNPTASCRLCRNTWNSDAGGTSNTANSRTARTTTRVTSTNS